MVLKDYLICGDNQEDFHFYCSMCTASSVSNIQPSQTSTVNIKMTKTIHRDL